MTHIAWDYPPERCLDNKVSREEAYSRQQYRLYFLVLFHIESVRSQLVRHI